MTDDGFDAWNARLNARSPVVSRWAVRDGRPVSVTGALLSFWKTGMRKRHRVDRYRPRPALEMLRAAVERGAER